MRIETSRLQELLDEANSFGARGDGGVERIAWTPAEVEARAWLLGRCEREGLQASYDEAGNVWAFAGARPAVVLGSHLDTVPAAGRFDGALGVCAALEVIRTARAAGEPGAERLALVCFTDEEGVRFGTGMTGSRAVAGDLTAGEVTSATDRDGCSLAEAMAAAGFDPTAVPRASARRADIDCYLELHVEQGRRLERTGLPVGVVSGIVGLRHLEVVCRGEANHAGTTAAGDRKDALLPVAAAALEARRVMEASHGVAATVGEARVVGGAPNIVPGLARCTLDVRALQEESIDAAVEAILDAARGWADACELEVRETKRLAPAHMAARVRAALTGAAASLGVEAPELESLAGHDAMTLTRAGVDCGMLFVRSRRGVSHSPAEYSSPEDCALAASVLGRAALELAAAGRG